MYDLSEAFSKAASKYAAYPACGPLAWEEVNGEVRIVRLLQDIPHVIVPNQIEGKPVRAISEARFMSAEVLETVTLPNSLREIGQSAFANCRHLRELTIPDSVEIIGGHAFRDSGVETIHLGAGVKELSTSAFAWAKDLRTVELSEGLRTIGCNAFYETLVGRETKFHIPHSVEKIAPGAFAGTFLTGDRLETDLPADPKWFLNEPEEGRDTLLDAYHQEMYGLLAQSAQTLAEMAVKTRLFYAQGFLTPEDAVSRVNDAWQEEGEKLARALDDLCLEKHISWSDTVWFTLRDMVLLSAGLKFHRAENTVTLLEDLEGAAADKIRTHLTRDEF